MMIKLHAVGARAPYVGARIDNYYPPSHQFDPAILSQSAHIPLWTLLFDPPAL